MNFIATVVTCFKGCRIK